MTVLREIAMGPVWFLPKRGFVVVPIVPGHRLPDGTTARGAVVGYSEDRLVAYANVCRHLAIPLDMSDGEVMDPDGEKLVCHHHGAVFEPASGLCVVGPCYLESLWRFAVRVEGGDAVLIVGGEELETPGPQKLLGSVARSITDRE